MFYFVKNDIPVVAGTVIPDGPISAERREQHSLRIKISGVIYHTCKKYYNMLNYNVILYF